MPPTGNGISSSEGVDPIDGQEYSSQQNNHITENGSNSSGEDITVDCATPDKDDEISDSIVVSPRPDSPPSNETDDEDDDDGVDVDDDNGILKENSKGKPKSTQTETTAIKSGKTSENSETAVSAVLYQRNLLLKKPTSTPSFVSIGLRKKATPFTIKSWAALAMTLDGRDKITKTLQYACRLLGWWLAGGPNKNTALRFTVLYKSLASSRKAFRLGRSLIEFEKLQSMGLVSLIFWHLEQVFLDDYDYHGDQESAMNHRSQRPRPKTLDRRASSNIGWGPATMEDEAEHESSSRYKRSLSRSLSSMAYRKMYRPLLSRMASSSTPQEPSIELWKAIGSGVKLLGLFGFWTGDNLNFLFSSGALDDFSLPDDQRLQKRARWQSVCSIRANQAYFGGSVAGLLVNLYTYLRFRWDDLSNANVEVMEATSPEDHDIRLRQLEKVKEKQFSLFLALLKSCCDVMVFSNNPGIDLHEKYRGKKNHEGLHCLSALVSAATVLYNNFPDK